MIWVKKAGAALDFTLDWADFLGEGDTISTSTWTVATGLMKGIDSKTATTTTVWLSGGTANTSYAVTGTIATVGGRTEVQEIEVQVLPAHILTVEEAKNALRLSEANQMLYELLPMVDSYINQATGRDWTQETPTHRAAKSAARMLLVLWHENPAMMGQGMTSLSHGLAAVLGQLEALALQYMRFQGSDGAGSCALSGALVGEQVLALTGLVGVTGDKSADFETEITVADQIQQTSEDDLSEYWYEAHLVPPGGLT